MLGHQSKSKKENLLLSLLQMTLLSHFLNKSMQAAHSTMNAQDSVNLSCKM
jgi:hypothetical protein